VTKKFPWFKFYPDEYSSGDIIYCSDATQGIFVRIMCKCWTKGELPKEPALLAKIIGSNEVAVKDAIGELERWSIIQDTSEDMFTLRFMKEQIDEMENTRDAKSQAGKKGMQSRWNK
jgi:hypothetical protein